MKNIIARTIGIIYGTYGSAHDPYGYSERSMCTRFSDGTQVSIMVHLGLNCKADVDGVEIDLCGTAMSEGGREFEKLTGISASGFISMIGKTKTRRLRSCRDCGSRKISGMSGFPGEYIYICGKCGRVADSGVDVSAVI